jgi:hypothetical protein
MAKKKAPAKPTSGVERLSVLNLKGSPEYHDWLGLISKKSLIPITTIVRDALSKWAKERGYPAPPEV